MYIGVKTLKNYAVMLRMVSDIFPMLILYSSGIQRDKDYIVSNDKLHKSNKLREVNDISTPSLSL